VVLINHGEARRSAPAVSRAVRWRRHRHTAAGEEEAAAASSADRDARHGLVERQGGRARAPCVVRRRRCPRARPQGR
jgi:hypothetical protein